MSGSDNEETNVIDAATLAEAEAEADARLDNLEDEDQADEEDAASGDDEYQVRRNTPKFSGSGKKKSRRLAKRLEAEAQRARDKADQEEQRKLRKLASSAASHEALRRGVEKVIEARASTSRHFNPGHPSDPAAPKPTRKVDKDKGGKTDSGDPYKKNYQTGPEDRASRSTKRDETTHSQAKGPHIPAKATPLVFALAGVCGLSG